MVPSGLLRVWSAAALTAGSGAVAISAEACDVRYNSSSVSFVGCAAEESACEGGGYIYGTKAFAQCVAALGGQATRVPERRVLSTPRAPPPAGPQRTRPSPPQTPPPQVAPPNKQP